MLTCSTDNKKISVVYNQILPGHLVWDFSVLVKTTAILDTIY